ncbi:flagellar basal body-associated FliL family protein [Sulfurospirillum sp. 1307]
MKMFSKIFMGLLICISFLNADEILRIDDFEVTLFSKINKSQQNIELSMVIEGRDVEVYDFKIIDALNVVIGSFYAEDLMMSKGKEALKQALINYALKKYSIDIDNVYIQKLSMLDNVSAKEIINELEKQGYIKK